MKVQVVYYSRGSNTKKVAERIASEVGAELELAKDIGFLDGDLVFLGSGVYAGSAHDSVKELLKKSDLSGKMIAPFATNAGSPYTFDDVKQAVEKAGGTYLDGFLCRGRFLFIINRGRPNESDLEDAANFAREAVEQISGNQ